MQEKTPKMIENEIKNYDEMMNQKDQDVFDNIQKKQELENELFQNKIKKLEDNNITRFLIHLREINPNIEFKLYAIPLDKIPFELIGLYKLCEKDNRKTFYMLKVSDNFDLPIDFYPEDGLSSWKHNKMPLNNLQTSFNDYNSKYMLPEKFDYVSVGQAGSIPVAVIGGEANKIKKSWINEFFEEEIDNPIKTR